MNRNDDMPRSSYCTEPDPDPDPDDKTPRPHEQGNAKTRVHTLFFRQSGRTEFRISSDRYELKQFRNMAAKNPSMT